MNEALNYAVNKTALVETLHVRYHLGEATLWKILGHECDNLRPSSRRAHMDGLLRYLCDRIALPTLPEDRRVHLARVVMRMLMNEHHLNQEHWDALSTLFSRG